MTDMSTFAGQAEHYRAVKAKFAAIKEPKPVDRVRHVPLRLREYADLNKPATKPPYVIKTPPEVSRQIVRDFLEVSSPDFLVDRFEWKEIVHQVAVKHRVTVQQIKSAQRFHYIVLARHEACYRLAHETTMSLPDIGRRLGGKDHTSVLHGMRRHAERNGLPMRERARLAA